VEDFQSGKRLFIRLPIRPQTVEELQLIHFWLQSISSTCFQRVSFQEQFNPEFLRLFFPAMAPVQFRAAELLTFPYNSTLPPLAYVPLVLAHHVEFCSGNVPFPDLLRLVCSFNVPPRQVKANIQGVFDREVFFKVFKMISDSSGYRYNCLKTIFIKW
jgi:hypothetical protein